MTQAVHADVVLNVLETSKVYNNNIGFKYQESSKSALFFELANNNEITTEVFHKSRLIY